MELLSQIIVVGHLTIEISVHDISHRMGFRDGDEPSNHLFVNLSAKDNMGQRVWTTHLLSEDGKVMPFSDVSSALDEAKRRVGLAEMSILPQEEAKSTTFDPFQYFPKTDLRTELKKDTPPEPQTG